MYRFWRAPTSSVPTLSQIRIQKAVQKGTGKRYTIGAAFRRAFRVLFRYTIAVPNRPENVYRFLITFNPPCSAAPQIVAPGRIAESSRRSRKAGARSGARSRKKPISRKRTAISPSRKSASRRLCSELGPAVLRIRKSGNLRLTDHSCRSSSIYRL